MDSVYIGKTLNSELSRNFFFNTFPWIEYIDSNAFLLFMNLLTYVLNVYILTAETKNHPDFEVPYILVHEANKYKSLILYLGRLYG